MKAEMTSMSSQPANLPPQARSCVCGASHVVMALIPKKRAVHNETR